MNEALTKYVKGLPLRRLLGGFILAIVWITPAAFQHAYSRNFQIQPMLYLLLFATFVLPLCALGLLWGWSERLKLERANAMGAEQLDEAIRRTVARNAATGMTCGLAFILVCFGTEFLQTSRTWDNSFLQENMMGAGLVGGAAVGVFAGIIAKRNLQRKAS
jgi:hypothetical protein